MHPDTVARIRRMVDFIKAFQAEYGTSPSYREIATQIGIAAPSYITRLMAQAEELGLLRRQYNKARRIEVLQ